MQLIKATVGFGLYVVKSSPDLKNTVQSAMASFLNMNLCKWVAEQGGWVSRAILKIAITCIRYKTAILRRLEMFLMRLDVNHCIGQGL